MRVKRDVLLLCQFFYPEYNSSATLPWDTARYLAACGFQVGALCGRPKEYNDQGTVPLRQEREGVTIRRLPYLQLKRGKKMARLINYFSFTGAVVRHIGIFRRYRAVIVYSNPPILPVAALLAKRLFGVKIIYVSYDVYPEVAYASGSLRKGGIIAKAMGWLNGRLFRQLEVAVTLTGEMRDFLLEKRPELTPRKAVVIPNWAHEEESRCQTQAEKLRASMGIERETFVISYFGNMGICQDMDTMMEAAELLKKDRHILFFLAGHGGKYQQVSDWAEKMPNVRVQRFLTGDEFLNALEISDCGLVSLQPGLKGTCAPSKYYSYLCAGIPVISITEPGSYLMQEIGREEIGRAVTVHDSTALAAAIAEVARRRELCREMGRRAQRLYMKKYQREKCLGEYARLVGKAVGKDSEHRYHSDYSYEK